MQQGLWAVAAQGRPASWALSRSPDGQADGALAVSLRKELAQHAVRPPAHRTTAKGMQQECNRCHRSHHAQRWLCKGARVGL